MVGFEENYESGLRDRNWGKALRNLVSGNASAELTSLVDKAICADLRAGKLGGLRALALAAQEVFQRAAAGSADQLFLNEDDICAIIQMFDRRCSPAASNAADPEVARLFSDLAMRELRRSLCDTSRLARCLDDIACDLVVDFLRTYASAKMEPAVPIACRKRHEAPRDVEMRLLLALGAVPFSSIAKRILAGTEGKIRATPRRRTNIADVVRQSLLR